MAQSSSESNDAAAGEQSTGHSLVFADRTKLYGLPSDVQNMVMGLTPAQLNKLRAALSKYDHFDLEKLPLELREMVYSYLVLPVSGIFLSPHSGTPIVCPPVLRTSKAICQEAQAVMYRYTTYRTAINMKEYWAIDLSNNVAFAHFRNIELRLEPLGWHIHEDETILDLPHFLRALVNIFAARNNYAPATLKITFEPRLTVSRYTTKTHFGIAYHETACDHGIFQPCQVHLPGTVEDQKEELKAAWMRAHLLDLVSNARTAISEMADYVSLETNVEQTGHNVRVQRVDEFNVKWKNLHLRKQGTMKIMSTRARKVRIQHAQGWDDSFEDYL